MHNNTANKSTISSTKTVFQSKFFHVDQVEIERDGKKFKKDIIIKTPFVAVLALTDNKEIYLESQYRDAFGKVMLEVPAGKIPNGEDPLEGARRELEEETGITASTWKQIATWELSPNMRQTINVFVAKDLKMGTQNLDDDEVIDLVKIPLAEAVEKIEKGEIVVGPDIAAILLLDKLMKEGKI